MWSCTATAFQSLSPALQKAISRLSAVHRDRSGLGRTAVHPVVRQIPLHLSDQSLDGSTKASLFINHQFTSHFEGWTPEESEPLLAYLLRQAIDPRFIYRHQWQPHDLIVWDNRQTLHFGIFDHHNSGSRVLHRTTAAYELPIPAYYAGPAASCDGAGSTGAAAALE